jgi:predicted transcriptional regulator
MDIVRIVSEAHTHAHGAVSLDQLKAMMGCPPSDLERHLWYLVRAGVIQEINATFRITPIGERLLSSITPALVDLQLRAFRRAC